VSALAHAITRKSRACSDAAAMTELWSNVANRWAIRHQTTYRYSTPVALAPHVLRLIPRPDGVQCLVRTLHITPTPIEVADFSDAFGNVCTRVTFSPGYANELVVDSRLEVEARALPVPDPQLSLPPLPWPVPAYDSLVAFRVPDYSPPVAALGQQIAREVGYAPLAFFERLNWTLCSTLDRQIRVEGSAQTPSDTLNLGRGACRDLTVLFLAVCRTLGVAGRFVSGYQGQEVTPDGRRHLHAWPEVFVPELGWLGWDPTHGVSVGRGHVALSAAPEQLATMPIEGGFYFNGPTVTSTLEYAIAFEGLSAL
jgi:transglutaminase-like putative cysteine protease